jgi:predicted RNase H-like HicB family nuclease
MKVQIQSRVEGSLIITIQYERDANGRWIADIPEFPSAIACGTTKAHAKAAATA